MKAWFRAGFNLLFPPLCRACRDVLPGDQDLLLCNPCRSRLVPIPLPICERCGAPGEEEAAESRGCRKCPPTFAPIDRYRSAVVYRSPFRELIHEFKFGGSRIVRPLLIEPFVRCADRFLPDRPCDLIVPVPLHWTRRFSREFNQSEILGKALAEAWGVPCGPGAVIRRRRTVPQSRLSGKWRAANIQGAFAPGRDPVEGLRILLVDDVMTSGSTLRECARVLLSSGARSVTAYTLARRF